MTAVREKFQEGSRRRLGSLSWGWSSLSAARNLGVVDQRAMNSSSQSCFFAQFLYRTNTIFSVICSLQDSDKTYFNSSSRLQFVTITHYFSLSKIFMYTLSNILRYTALFLFSSSTELVDFLPNPRGGNQVTWLFFEFSVSLWGQDVSFEGVDIRTF